jgi:hypothetical protein
MTSKVQEFPLSENGQARLPIHAPMIFFSEGAGSRSSGPLPS